MNIVVCVKQTPDTAATISIEEGKATWGDAPLVLNPWDEYAVEQAILTREELGGKVTALSLGPEEAREALKLALAMGCDEAILINDPLFESADTLIVSRALAAGIMKLGEVELVFFGRASVDSDSGVLGSQTARRLGWPSISWAAAISHHEGAIEVERMIDEGRQVVRSSLPAVISVVKEINEPRYPSFMGIRKASKAEIPTWSAESIGIDGSLSSAVTWPEMFAPQVKSAECEFIAGQSAQEIAEGLADRLIAEKVI